MGDRQIFIGNLCNLTIEALRTYCEKYGPLTELSLNRDKENNVYHCFAFVTFQSTRSISTFMSDRPHIIGGDEVFVKRALPRLISSIPERLIVTNRLVIQDLTQYDKHAIQNHFQKFGHIKKIDFEHDFIDFEDYDDVDRILLARPHYIRDKEIFVTKFVPSEQQVNPNNNYLRSNPHHHHDHHHHRSNSNSNHQHSIPNNNKQSTRSFKSSTDPIKVACTSKVPIDKQNDDNEEKDEGIDCHYLNIRCARLEDEFQEYKKDKESELCALKMDLERTKQQLADTTQKKLDLLLKNQKLFHDEVMLSLNSNNSSIQSVTSEELFLSSPSLVTKKRKLTESSPSLPVAREYEYYS